MTIAGFAYVFLMGTTPETQPTTAASEAWANTRDAETWYSQQLSQLRSRHDDETARLRKEFVRRLRLCLDRAMDRRDLVAANAFETLGQHVAVCSTSQYPNLELVGPSGNLLSRMHVRGETIDRGREIRLSSDTLLESTEEYCSPLEIEFEVKLDRGDLRLFFARGCIILNWGIQPTELRIQDFAHGGIASAQGKGTIPVGKWIRCKVQLDDETMRVSVDDVERLSHNGLYKKLPGRIAIGTGHEGLLTVRKIEVRPLK